MTSYAATAELARLALLLRVDSADVAYLDSLDAAQLRALRTTLEQRIAAPNRSAHERIAHASNLLPARAIATLAMARMPPRLSAAVVAQMTPQHAADLAAAMSPDYLRQVCCHLSMSSARGVPPLLPSDVLAAVLHEQMAHRDILSMAEVVGALDDDQLRTMVRAFDDMSMLLGVILSISDVGSAQRVLRALPEDMRQRLIAAAEPVPAQRSELAVLLADEHR
ncbi:MAG: hypothetical protein AVDCRST_MAG21-1310 [uncultured Nocardioidaceae bacterium]|uniref:Uncharacterized protein n=1 Tax=uncultured Nocardioidaceae bacterium TaxID=253824 RepID=A0A6J4N315_9ACTN|nr:MAG: hypothetical protein AVDCRST_MAG21-1310 [uncultured Nocardioidaceae bacterium]